MIGTPTRWLFALLLLLPPQVTLPDWMRSSQRDLPSEVFPAPTQAAAPAPAAPDITYKDEPYVFERLVHRVRFESDGTSRGEVEERIRVQNDAGVQQWGQLV